MQADSGEVKLSTKMKQQGHTSQADSLLDFGPGAENCNTSGMLPPVPMAAVTEIPASNPQSGHISEVDCEAEFDGTWEVAVSRSSKRRTRSSAEEQVTMHRRQNISSTVACARAVTEESSHIESVAESVGPTTEHSQTLSAAAVVTDSPPQDLDPASGCNIPNAESLKQADIAHVRARSDDGVWRTRVSTEACQHSTMLEELQNMRSDELLRWFHANGATGWLGERVHGLQSLDSMPRTILLKNAALLLDNARAEHQQAKLTETPQIQSSDASARHKASLIASKRDLGAVDEKSCERGAALDEREGNHFSTSEQQRSRKINRNITLTDSSKNHSIHFGEFSEEALTASSFPKPVQEIGSKQSEAEEEPPPAVPEQNEKTTSDAKGWDPADLRPQ